MDDPALWCAVTSSLIGCYFAACNISLKTFSRKRMGDMYERIGQDERFDLFVDRLETLELMTATMRTVFNLVVILAMLLWVQGLLPDRSVKMQFITAFVFSVVLLSIFTVAISFSLARYHPEKLLSRSMGLLTICYWLFIPVKKALKWVDPFIRRLSGGTEEDLEEEFGDQIMSVVEEHEDEGELDEDQKELIEAVVEFPHTDAGEIMTPRTDVVGIEKDASLDQVKEIIASHGLSRYPVYEENADQIVGILYAKDLIQYLGASEPFELSKVLRHALMVPESKSVQDLLAEFKQSKVHIAIVLDEYGGTAGLVTIEDIIEEIVGEIQDEYEEVDDTPEMRQIDDATFDIDGRVHIDDVNDELKLELPEDEDYDTLGGFVFHSLGHIPVTGETFEVEKIRLTVTEAERTRVVRVRLELLEGAISSKNGSSGRDSA